MRKTVKHLGSIYESYYVEHHFLVELENSLEIFILRKVYKVPRTPNLQSTFDVKVLQQI